MKSEITMPITEMQIQNKICLIRNVQVMLDRDLAELYQVELRVLNQAVRRNINRFPDNFMFEVDKSEIRSLITNCDLSEKMRYWPQKSMVFTEQGIAIATISNSCRSQSMVSSRANDDALRGQRWWSRYS